MPRNSEPHAQCPCCGHCAHGHYLATVRYDNLPSGPFPVLMLGCEDCEAVCPAEDDKPVRNAILSFLFSYDYRRYLANGL